MTSFKVFFHDLGVIKISQYYNAAINFAKNLVLHCLSIVFILFVFLQVGCIDTDEKISDTESVTKNNNINININQLKQMFPDSIGQGNPIIIDFYSKLCLSCQKLKPKLEKISSTPPFLHLYSIDIANPSESDRNVVKAFKVMTVPYVIFISGNGEIKKIILEDVPTTALDEAKSALVSKI